MATGGRVIRDGDTVVAFSPPNNTRAVTVDAASAFNNKNGSFDMRDWIGRPFGCTVWPAKPPGGPPLYLLALTPELWTVVLRHRTQILYLPDISMVCGFLEARPGVTLLESGTGSGSLSHALARAVTPGGHLFTFEYHKERADWAREEFESHGLQEVVTVTQRDIEVEGFPDELSGKAHGVFLDLPSPWKVVQSAHSSLRSIGGRISTFSPCMEQVQKTVERMRACGFTDVRVMECLARDHQVKTVKFLTNFTAGGGNWEGRQGKRARTQFEAAKAPGQTEGVEGSKPTQPADSVEGGPGDVDAEQGLEDEPTEKDMCVSQPGWNSRGHTGYLVFARKWVEVPEQGWAKRATTAAPRDQAAACDSVVRRTEPSAEAEVPL
ncbi:unnamed protein product [Ostreobium quekettii]|uniref:tRNA (adenine(58)-N(1))-methyltransferase n=1 Tax=Ostreobium quekettii TaxID=121088 RepID=A0A8S1JAR7_9CHLO|nr:unnamed protein product [Ostreobium quekettii]|eukprot:evm.model.scf_660EXC.3 EVM.evm.TU.scf_660EXC.3   scf_660EXC:19754-24693(+)